MCRLRICSTCTPQDTVFAAGGWLPDVAQSQQQQQSNAVAGLEGSHGAGSYRYVLVGRPTSGGPGSRTSSNLGAVIPPLPLTSGNHEDGSPSGFTSRSNSHSKLLLSHSPHGSGPTGHVASSPHHSHQPPPPPHEQTEDEVSSALVRQWTMTNTTNTTTPARTSTTQQQEAAVGNPTTTQKNIVATIKEPTPPRESPYSGVVIRRSFKLASSSPQ